MPITKEEFTKLNIMAGTARSLDQKELDSDEREIWDRDFRLLCDELTELIDPELGKNLANEKKFYTSACQVGKGYFDKPFGGLKQGTGQYGFRFLIPQDWRDAALGGTGHQFYSWRQTKVTGATTTAFDLWGSSASPILAETTAEKKGVISLHKIISYDPDPRVIMMQWTVNEYPYSPYAVEPFSKIAIPNKLYKLLPIPGRIILHPGGKLYLKVWIDKRYSGTTLPSVATTIDIELVPFGLIFAENSYLNIDTNIV